MDKQTRTTYGSHHLSKQTNFLLFDCVLDYIVYSRSYSLTEIERDSEYVLCKWCRSLPSNHPSKDAKYHTCKQNTFEWMTFLNCLQKYNTV